jgi:hypothetical protein
MADGFSSRKPASASPLTARDRELAAMQPVASQMPVVFANGTRCDEITGSCFGCCHPILKSALRGVVSRPLPTVAVIECVGLCPSCRLITRFYFRLHSDLRVTGLHNGRWCEWRARRTFIGSIRHWIGTLIRRLSA